MSEKDEEGLSHDMCGGKCSPGRQCNGTCIDENSPERRYLCEEEGECKNIAETCDRKCKDRRYFCKENATCSTGYDNIMNCKDGCSKGQFYCTETNKCHTRHQPCFGECRQEVKGHPNVGTTYCEATNSCNLPDAPCDGVCLNTEMIFCQGLDMCYKPNERQKREKCLHFNMNCTTEEWICQDKCLSIYQPCHKRSSPNKPFCVHKFGGTTFNHKWCEDTKTCNSKEQPCKGQCLKSNERLCEDEGKCIHRAKTCCGKCLKGKVKCPNEDRCIHENAIKNGKKKCKEV